MGMKKAAEAEGSDAGDASKSGSNAGNICRNAIGEHELEEGERQGEPGAIRVSTDE